MTKSSDDGGCCGLFLLIVFVLGLCKLAEIIQGAMG